MRCLLLFIFSCNTADNDPREKLRRIIRKFNSVAESSVGAVLPEYYRMEIKKKRVENLGTKMEKHLEKINGKCIFLDFAEDELEVR